MFMDAKQVTQQINDCRSRADKLAGGLSLEQLIQRVDPGKWSIAECIAHLNLTARLVQKITAKAIADARAASKGNGSFAGPFRMGARGRILVWVAEPPPKFRMPAPKRVAPPLSIDDPAQLLPDFMRAQDGWERLLKDAEGLDLSRIVLGTLFSPFRCRMSGGMLWMMAHQRRHLWQGENVRKQLSVS